MYGECDGGLGWWAGMEGNMMPGKVTASRHTQPHHTKKENLDYSKLRSLLPFFVYN